MAQDTNSEREQAILARTKNTYLSLMRKWANKRDRSHTTSEYIKGIQWEEKTIKDLDKLGLPALTLNIMLPIMLRIFGAERQSRGKLKAVPMREASMEIANVFTKLFDWMESICHTNEQFGKAFKQAVTTDLGGFVELVWDTSGDPRGEPKFRHVNSFFILLGDHENDDLSDCKEYLKTFFMTKEDLMDIYPKKRDLIERELQTDRRNVFMRTMDSVLEKFGASKFIDTDFRDTLSGQFRVIEHYEKRTIEEFLTPDEEQDLVKIPKDRVEELEQQGAKIITQPRTITVVSTTVADQIVLQEPKPLAVQTRNGQFPIFKVPGLNIDGDAIGLAWQLVGPQDEYNKARSSQLHEINTSASSGWTYEDGALDTTMEDRIENKGAMAGLILKFQSGFKAPEKIKPNTPPTSQINRAAEAKEDMQFISSVNPNSLGRRETSQESGKLFTQRVEEFLSTLQEFFSGLNNAMVRGGDYAILTMQTLMKDERPIQIADTGEEFVINEEFNGEVFNDISHGKFGARTEVAATTEVVRRELVALLVQTLQYAPPEVAPVIVKLIFEKLELPEKDRLEIVEAISQVIPPSARELLEAETGLGEDLNELAEPGTPQQVGPQELAA